MSKLFHGKMPAIRHLLKAWEKRRKKNIEMIKLCKIVTGKQTSAQHNTTQHKVFAVCYCCYMSLLLSSVCTEMASPSTQALQPAIRYLLKSMNNPYRWVVFSYIKLHSHFTAILLLKFTAPPSGNSIQLYSPVSLYDHFLQYRYICLTIDDRPT